MRFSIKSRIALDAAMAVAIISALAFRITGERLHEWLGLAACALIALHILANARWYLVFFKGKYGASRLLNAAVNSLLLCSFIMAAATGVFQSKFAMPFMGISETMQLRQIHSTSAYWMMFLGAMHLGIKWKTVSKYAAPAGCRARAIFRIFLVAMALCGIYSWIDRGMFDKLFMGYSFDYWDDERPPALFFCESASIILLVACAANLSTAFIGSIFKQNRNI